MFGLLIVFIIAFFWAFIDSFIPFVPPVTFGIAGLMTQTSFPIVATILNGIAIGAGSVCAVLFYRRLSNKITSFETNPKITKWRHRITILIDEIGYKIIIPLAATSLIAMVCYTFVLAEHINYRKLFIYITLGRTLLLAITAFGVTVVTDGETTNFIFASVIYGAMFVYVIVILILNLHVFSMIKNKEQQ